MRVKPQRRKIKKFFKKVLTNKTKNAIINTEIRKGSPKGLRYKTMTVIRYRVVYRDGSHGAWNADKDNVERLAKEFNGRVETWIVELP